MAQQTIGAVALRSIVAAFSDALVSHREAINNLNVYPVPDGDTGTNMSLTLRSVVEELETKENELAALCEGIAHGSLMGARGNSGVILSQILREFAQVLTAHAEVDATLFAQGLVAAAKGAYRAVGNPVEGTILTVVRESADAAAAAADSGLDLCAVVGAARDEAAASLERTPQLLSVLADAGVVDAGGAGFLLFYHATLNVIDDVPIPEPQITAPAKLRQSSTNSGLDANGSKEKSLADLRYEVMFLLDAEDDKIAGFKEAWAEVGDSIVVVGGSGLHNCHIHCDDIGAAIECAIAVGRPHQIRVTDLLDELTENHEQSWVAEALDDLNTTQATPQTYTTAVVAVGAGMGVTQLLESSGVQRVVAGGQTMNPSTRDLLAAVEELAASEVVILPNNKNIIAVAKQVNDHTSRSVEVVATTSVVEALSCLMAYDPQASAAQNAQLMTKAMREVLSGEVTQAVRQATCEIGAISQGDWLGISTGKIVVAATSVTDAATELLAEMIGTDHELLTVIVGADTNELTTASIKDWVSNNHPSLEWDIHNGGQPHYLYYFGLE